MNEVQPIKSKRHINAVKAALAGRNRLLFVVGVNSGLRISDILTLKVGDVRGKDFVSIREGKTKKPKRFALNAAIKRAVRDLVPADAPDSEYLFRSRKGANKPISRVQAYRILNEAVERAGLAGKIGEVGTHSLRKTFGYHAYTASADIGLLMRIFNHSSEKQTLQYIGQTQEDIDDVYVNISL
ncbi:site-specific integrase [Salibacterium aidingense]|uniref:site-specific integrase n=1 Tax=Salibacterium aidingense TaxID=384933 RepID=UPI003BD5CB09